MPFSALITIKAFESLHRQFIYFLLELVSSTQVKFNEKQLRKSSALLIYYGGYVSKKHETHEKVAKSHLIHSLLQGWLSSFRSLTDFGEKKAMVQYERNFGIVIRSSGKAYETILWCRCQSSVQVVQLHLRTLSAGISNNRKSICNWRAGCETCYSDSKPNFFDFEEQINAWFVGNSTWRFWFKIATGQSGPEADHNRRKSPFLLLA